MDGEFLDEDNGATLYCDTCNQQVRSNEAHRCSGFEAVPLCDPRLLECLRKVKNFIECEGDRKIDDHPKLQLHQLFHFQEMERTFNDAAFALRPPEPPKVEAPEPVDTTSAIDGLRDLHKALTEASDLNNIPQDMALVFVERAITALGGKIPAPEVEEFTLIVHLDFELKDGADAEDFLSEMNYSFSGADTDSGKVIRSEIMSWQRR